MIKLKKEIPEHEKYFTTEIFSATLKEVDITDFIKKTDFDNKLKDFN